MSGARERIAAAPPAAVELARVLSLAVSVEPELLRRARLTLTRLDASAEADLWWSELVSARNPRGLTLHTEVAEQLRRELAEDADLFERAWALVERLHEDASWALRLEEKLRYVSLLPAPRRRERSRQLLAAAGREMTEGTDGKDSARWLARALPQMPASVREGGEARALEAGAAMRLTGWLDPAWMEELPEGATEDWLHWVMPDDLPRISVPVRLLEGAVEIGEESWEGGQTLVLPETQPLALEVTWYEGTRPVRRWVTWEEGETRRVAIGSDWVELATLSGERYRLRDAERTQAVGSTGSGTDELDFGPLKAKHRPFLDREEVMEELEQWVGRGSVHVDGASGIGKTALLCALVDRLEASRRPCIYHFVAEEVPGSEDPERAERSLVAQLRRYFPEFPGHLDLEKALARVSEEEAPATYEDTGSGPTLPVIVLDGDVLTLDRFAGSVFVQRLVFSGEVRGRLGVTFVHLLLDEKVESNRRLCESYLELHAEEIRRLATTESHLPPEQVLLERARGVIGRLVGMHEWLRRQEQPPARLERMPPTLYGEGELAWERLKESSGMEPHLLRLPLEVLSVAREPFPLTAFLKWAEEADNLLEAAEVLLNEGWLSRVDVGVVALADPSVRDFVEKTFEFRETSMIHLDLGQLLPWTGEKPDREDHAFERLYGLRHSWKHLLESEQWEDLQELFTDGDYLSQVVRELGVEALRQRVEEAAAQSPLGDLEDLAAVVRQVAARLERHPEDLPSILSNVPSGEGVGFSMKLRTRDGRPVLRLRQLLSVDPDLIHASATTAANTVHCAGELDDSRRILITGAGGSAQLWSFEAAEPVTLPHEAPVVHCAVSRGQEPLYVTADAGGTLRSWNNQGELIEEEPVPPGEVTALALDAVGARVVAATRSNEGRLVTSFWRGGGGLIGEGRPTWVTPDRVNMLRTGAADLVAIATERGTILWNQASGAELQSFRSGETLCCDLQPRLDYLLTGTRDGKLRLWDLGTGRLLAALRGHEGPVRACRLAEVWTPAPERPRLAVSAGEDATVRLWDLHAGKLLETVYGDRPFMDLTASHDLSVIVAVDSAAVGWVLDRTGPVTEQGSSRPPRDQDERPRRNRRPRLEASSLAEPAPVFPDTPEKAPKAEARVRAGRESGKVFLSYKRERAEEVRLLAEALRDIGVDVWQDVRELRPGAQVLPEIRQALEGPDTVGAVLWIAPEVAGSESILKLEVPLALERSEKEDFFVLPVAAGGLDRSKALGLARSAGVPGNIADWYIEQVSEPMDEAQAQQLALRVLSAYLAQVDQALPPEEPLRLGLYTRPDAHVSRGHHLLLDWRHRFDGREARPGVWESHLLPALQTLARRIGEMDTPRRVEARGQLSLAAATALGAAFLKPRGIELGWWPYSRGGETLWTLSEEPEESGFEARVEEGDFESDEVVAEVAICISVVEDVRPTLVASQEGLALFRRRIFLEKQGGYPHDLTPGQAVHLALLTVRALRESRPFRRAHLFLAGPVGLAVLLGQLLNTISEVQTYELVEGRYKTAALLRP